MLTGYLSLGCRSGGNWTNTYLLLDKMFYNFLFKREVVAATVTFKFSSLSHSLTRPFLEICYLYHALIVQYNYNVHL